MPCPPVCPPGVAWALKYIHHKHLHADNRHGYITVHGGGEVDENVE
ncbi:MAG: hypothetical protein ACP5R0_04040 [Thermoplasmata archaeon]